MQNYILCQIPLPQKKKEHGTLELNIKNEWQVLKFLKQYVSDIPYNQYRRES